MKAARKVESFEEDRKCSVRGFQDVFDKSERKPLVVNDSQYNDKSFSIDYISGSQAESNEHFMFQNSNFSSHSIKWCDDLPLAQRSFEDDRDRFQFIKPTRDIGTMTDIASDKHLELETRCNELFGRMVACEISNINGKARYDKMKEIIGLFQSI